MTEEETISLAAHIDAIKAKAEAASPFKRFQPVRCCRWQGSKLIGEKWVDNPHDHNDPEQHFDSRVVGWDSLGRVQVATMITNNPHCSEWCWSDDKVEPRSGWDWFTDRQDDRIWQKVGSPIFFMWEEPGWIDQRPYDPIVNDHFSVGETVRAVLEAPHINYGDWIVRYEKKSARLWITRVVNERQMWERND